MKTSVAHNHQPQEMRHQQTEHLDFVSPEGENAPVLQYRELLRVLMVAVAALASWFLRYDQHGLVGAIGIAATLLGGYPIFHEAFENLRQRRMTMELSMTIALVAALLIGQIFTALVITLFVLLAEILEHMTVARGKKAIVNLLDLLPQTVELCHGDQILQVQRAALKRGDIILVRPGACIPVDGEVFKGASHVDQSAITGEPLPVKKLPGSLVFAGTINQTGTIELLAEKLDTETAFGKIVEAVEEAEKSRAPIEKISDQLAAYLVYFSLAAALLTFALTSNIRSTIAVIIVAGACGVAAGTPLAILGAIGRCANAGAIVKGGRYIEQLAKIDTVVFDKTGTLTMGTPAVIRAVLAPGKSKEELLRFAGIAERNSEHPLARAISEYVQCNIGAVGSPDKFHYDPGRGITARVEGSTIYAGSADYLSRNGIHLPEGGISYGLTEVLIARNREYLGSFVIDDQLRVEAKQAIDELRSMGIQTVLLTGDTSSAAKRIGRELKLDDTVAELLPQEKLNHIKALQEFKRRVAMVGDGINDAPALAQADVGIAMGSGTDVAQKSADVVLIGSNLLKVAETLRIARRCRRIILQNFGGTLVVDAIGMLLAGFGILRPLLAVLIHVASELTFILNSARLIPAGSLSTLRQVEQPQPGAGQQVL
jgi:heavy metal translocating P-type ATPase